jgi:hypothetical protein
MTGSASLVSVLLKIRKGSCMSDSSLTPAELPWTPVERYGFRFASCYLLLYAFTSGNDNLLYLIPKAGAKFASWLSLAWQNPAVWLAQHYFHIAGIGSDIHATGSGDTAIHWIGMGIMFAYSLIAAALWSILDRRAEYRTASTWLRFVLRLTLVMAMANYGFSKLFPMQMPPPSLAVLNESVGNLSPMTLLWTFLGVNPVYESVAGAAEVAAAFLLFFRRTALLGAILAGLVMSNVLLFELFFDVPVKIYAGHLVLFAIAVIAPDLRALREFFWRHKPASLTSLWAPALQRRPSRIGIRLVEIALAVMVLTSVPGHYESFAKQLARARSPEPLTGQWHVDSATVTINGLNVFRPVLTGNGLPATDIFLEPNGRLTLRDSSGQLWRAGADVQDENHTFTLYRESADPIAYYSSRPDPTHLVLTPTQGASGTLYLTRVPLPSHYPLLERGFHFVNEWPLER